MYVVYHKDFLTDSWKKILGKNVCIYLDKFKFIFILYFRKLNMSKRSNPFGDDNKVQNKQFITQKSINRGVNCKEYMEAVYGLNIYINLIIKLINYY